MGSRWVVTGEGMGVLPGTGNPGLDLHVSVYSLVFQVCAPFCVKLGLQKS